MKGGYVYILASQRNGSLYIGVTKDIVKRLSEHRASKDNTHTGRYKIHTLVYYELYPEIKPAIDREKQLKKFNRIKKKELIEEANPTWRDLSEDWRGNART